jgi:hypothetical protein
VKREKKKGKKEKTLPPAGPNLTQTLLHPLSLPRAPLPPPPPEAQFSPPPARACAAPTDSPTPPVSRARPRSLATALPLAGGPHLSAPFPLTRDQAIDTFAARPIASLLTRSPAWFGTLRPRALCPSRPVATACPSRPVATVCHHRRRGKRRRCSPPLLPPLPGRL